MLYFLSYIIFIYLGGHKIVCGKFISNKKNVAIDCYNMQPNIKRDNRESTITLPNIQRGKKKLYIIATQRLMMQ